MYGRLRIAPNRAAADSSSLVNGMGARASRPLSRACARRTLTLTLSHKGRGGPLTAVRAWFRLAYSCKPSE